MELSKPIKTINYSLLLTRLEAYGFSTDFLILIPNYLCNRFQKTKVNGSFSDWNKILVRLPQVSILDPLLFNYADDNTQCAINKNLYVVKSNLEVSLTIMQRPFYENHLVLNPENANIY